MRTVARDEETLANGARVLLIGIGIALAILLAPMLGTIPVRKFAP
jgi:hypothetical protein